jgi:hypothetical protein
VRTGDSEGVVARFACGLVVGQHPVARW